MDEISKSVIQNIKNGQYYQDARRWYNHKYLYPIVERSFLLLITGVTTIAFLFIIYNFNALFPLHTEVPFVVKVEDSLEHYSVIRSLGKESGTPQELTIKYLLEEYVKTYESYVFKDIEKQKAKVRGGSSKQVYKAFTSFMSVSNPESPLLLYQKQIVRTVKVRSILLPEGEDYTSRATIVFDTTLDDRLRNTKTANRYQAVITFNISSIHDVIDKEEKLEFIVTDYQVRKIK